jgi:hypothetical protein
VEGVSIVTQHGFARKWFGRVVLLLAVAWLPLALAAPVDRSDMNNDGAVDTLDLEIFANTFLGQDWQTVDWCGFYESSITDEKYFRSITSDKTVNYQELLDFIALSYNCEATDPNDDRSDLNGDGFVDLSDLIIFSTNYLGRSWDSVDWCLFLDSTLAGADFEGQSTKFYLQHFELLLTFINSYFYCDGPEPPANNLQLENKPIDLVRIADAAYITNDYYITDPRIGSLFIYDENLVRKAEIKGLNRPLTTSKYMTRLTVIWWQCSLKVWSKCRRR